MPYRKLDKTPAFKNLKSIRLELKLSGSLLKMIKIVSRFLFNREDTLFPFLKKLIIPGLFFVNFRSFSNKHYILQQINVN